MLDYAVCVILLLQRPAYSYLYLSCLLTANVIMSRLLVACVTVVSYGLFTVSDLCGLASLHDKVSHPAEDKVGL